MARKSIGSVIKGKDGKPDYIKVSQNVTLKAGQYINLESVSSRLENIEKGVASGKLKPESAEKMREFVNNTPSFVRFELTIDEAKK